MDLGVGDTEAAAAATEAGHGRSIRPLHEHWATACLLTSDGKCQWLTRGGCALLPLPTAPPRASSDVPVDRPPPSAVCGVEWSTYPTRIRCLRKTSRELPQGSRWCESDSMCIGPRRRWWWRELWALSQRRAWGWVGYFGQGIAVHERRIGNLRCQFRSSLYI